MCGSTVSWRRRISLAALAMPAGLSFTMSALAQPPECDTSAGSNGESASELIDFGFVGGFSYDPDESTISGTGFWLCNGEVELTADEASAIRENLDNPSGEWTLSGNVRIEIDSMLMTAGTATFAFSDGELVFGELTGEPVRFDYVPADQATPVVGTSTRIYYDHAERSVRLTGDVLFTDGNSRASWCDLVYLLDTGGFRSGPSQCEPGGGMRVQAADSDESDDDEAAAP